MSLSDGAIVIFGPEALRTVEDLRAGGLLENNLAIVSVPAAGLALPDAELMIFAMLLFDHPLKGPSGMSVVNLALWKDKLLTGLSFAAPGEPEPAVKLTGDEETGKAMLTLEWLPPDSGDWRGVRAGQVKRAALAIEEAYKRLI
ncbi:MAG: hypothetical protein HY923_04650 [Elusimicrobia bacterium]|nr:hypothetical protein [Elusimicrobiota bacterium]